MQNVALQIVDEVLHGMDLEDMVSGSPTGFIIDSDSKAEWALSKISEETAEAQRYINVCQTMINGYQFKIEQCQKQLENKVAGLKSQLEQYFRTVPHKKTKTQETYKLPSGTLKLKHQAPEYERDEEKLLKWLKDNDMSEYIKAKESAKWADLKPTVKVSGDKVITADGEIIDGVTVIQRPDVFEIEL